MVRLISRQRGGHAALKLTKLFGINDFPAAKDSGKVLIIIIYCYLIIIIDVLVIATVNFTCAVAVAGSGVGAVVRTFAPHRCVPGSIRHHLRVEFNVGSLIFSERFTSGYSGFSLFPKTNISKFLFRMHGHF